MKVQVFWNFHLYSSKIWLFFKFYFIFKLYIIVLVLPNIKMNPPQVYMCSPSWTLLPPHGFLIVFIYFLSCEFFSDSFHNSVLVPCHHCLDNMSFPMNQHLLLTLGEAHVIGFHVCAFISWTVHLLSKILNCTMCGICHVPCLLNIENFPYQHI